VNTPRILIAATAAAAVALGATNAAAQATFSRVSIATDGSEANSDSDGASISADGRYVAFSSSASNLVPNDTNGARDIFVRDRLLNTTTRVSVTSTGEQRIGDSTAPGIGGSGRFVVFLSTAPLVVDDTQTCQPAPALPGCQDVYVHDRETATTTRANVSSAGVQADADSYEPHISSDGRFVVFESLATTLASGGPSGARHAFLRDRQTNTTIRLQGFNAVPQLPGEPEPRISDDGRTVSFSGFVVPQSLPVTPEGTAPACWHAGACPTTYLYDTSSGSTTMVSSLFPGVKSGSFLFADEAVYLSGDGNHIILKQVMIAASGSPPPSDARFLSFRRSTSAAVTGPWRSSGELADIVGLSGDGRYHAWMGPGNGAGGNPHTRVFHDYVAGLDDTVTFAASPESSNDPPEMSLSFDARFSAFATRTPIDAADTNGTIDIYVMDRDADGDGMPSGWETRFGLLPGDGTDAAGDADGDGVGNLAEYQRGSHADKKFTRYLAEGAANAFFSTRLALVNPQDTPVDVAVRLLGSNQNRVTQLRTLPARSRSTINFTQSGGVLGDAPSFDFATVVESKQPIVVDRTMTWNAQRYGAHAETAIDAPQTTWYLAEGATHGSFDLFYLLLNATGTETAATVKYLRPAPLPPIVKTYSVPANGRKTIYVDVEDAELAATDVSAIITSDQPIVVERAMYSSLGGVPFAAGHGGAAVAAPADTWFLAEGATGNFFDLYLLIANPGQNDTSVSITYLLPDGQYIQPDFIVPAESRTTISVDQNPVLSNTPVSMIVRTTNHQPIIVERAMWWPSPNWYEAHLSAGATSFGTRWALADGEIGSEAGEVKETYILIANTGGSDDVATVTLLVEGGAPVVAQIPIKAQSRTNVPVSGLFPAGSNAKFGALIETTGAPIVVERSMYTSAGGVTWTAGTAALATKLQ
jgi:Tol biopolymer transport system component